MTKDQISKYAFMNEMPDVEMSCPERCLWYALKDVYRRFQSGDLTKAQGDVEKKKAFRQYEIDASKLEAAKRIVAHDANMWVEIELAGSAYGMNRTLENADVFFSAVYGVKLKGKPSQTGGDAV